MPPRERRQDDDARPQKREIFDTLISEQILHKLGVSDKLQSVQVRRLWEGHYRVNIFLGKDLVFAQISNSYFVTVDGDGHIVESNPKLPNVH